MSSNEIEQYRQLLADHDARELAQARTPRPDWRVALDDLLVANYSNDAFWAAGGLSTVMQGHVPDDDMRLVRAWFAGKCRICDRPMHEVDVRQERCRDCGAQVTTPAVITGTVMGPTRELM